MNKKRVVITGIGLISSIGNNIEEVTQSLYNGTSGININQSYIDKGLMSHISGQLPDPIKTIGNKKITRMMSPGAAYCFLSMKQALADAHLPEELISNPQTGMIIGTGGGSPLSAIEVAQKVNGPGVQKLLPFYSARCMASSAVANLAVLFQIKGLSFSVSSACATSAHAIGEAYEKIMHGKLNTVLCGGCDEHDAYVAASFDRAGALSRNNAEPQKASRPYDINRDGFVISAGGGIVILEEREQAINRGAKIHAEILGYGTSSDGYHMTKPDPTGEGIVRCMEQAFNEWPAVNINDIDYINTHGTSTPAGDIVELKAVGKVFESRKTRSPLIGSTKSLSGHALGAAGVHELIYSIIMMRENFIAGSANIENIDAATRDFQIVRERLDTPLSFVMSNSFGFGGTNATIIIKKP